MGGAGTQQQQQQQPSFVLPLRRALEMAGVSAVDSQAIIDEELMNDWNRSHAERVDFRNSHSCRSGLHCLRRKTSTLQPPRIFCTADLIQQPPQQPPQ